MLFPAQGEITTKTVLTQDSSSSENQSIQLDVKKYMRLVNLPLLISSLLLCFCIQISPVRARIDTLRTFPEKRFTNGVMDFGQYVARNLRYPLQAQQAAIVGTSLVSIIITPAGKLTNITIVNSLGKAIDGEVRRLIESTGKMWMPADQSTGQDSILFVLPVTFMLNDTKFYVESNKPAFVLKEKEAVVIGMNPLVTTLKDDDYFVTKLNQAAQEKDYKRMLNMVNELIRRNPYSDKLYLQRANIERELGQTEEACSDYKKIIYLLGRSSFPKHFTQNCP